MLKVDRTNRTFSPLDSPSLANAQFLERADLQECIYNSSDAFFAEIGEDVFVAGKEVAPSKTVQDRIDLLGIDPEGTLVIVELKRGSNKLQMLQAISYAGMVARWGPDELQALLSDEEWEELTNSFLDVEPDDINRHQRLLLVAEGFDYALLSGAEWLSEHHGVDIRCTTVSLSTDEHTGTEYLACASIFPPPALAEQAAARNRSSHSSRPVKWQNWDEAISQIENDAVREFAQEELDNGRENYLRKRALRYRIDGKRRWSLHCRNKHAYVWQGGRFPGDVEYWESRLSNGESVSPVKDGQAVSFRLVTEDDLQVFREATSEALTDQDWMESSPAEQDEDNGVAE
jgi:hypothetical protein